MNSLDAYAEPYKGVRVLVLGAAGFVGRWTARRLCAAGADLFLPVRDISAARLVFDEFGISGNVHRLDLLETARVAEFVGDIRPAVIFDLAGYGVDRTEDSEAIAFRINAQLPEILCSAMMKSAADNWSGQKIVRTGTALEYGAATGDLEENSTPDPTTVYGRSNLAGTLSLRHWSRKFGQKCVTARLFSVYGAGEHPARLLPTLIRSRATGEAVELTSGTQERDFVYVEDVAEGLLRLGLMSIGNCDIVNLATGVLTTVRNFTESAADELGISRKRLKFGALPTRPEEMRHGTVSVKRLKDLVGWLPQTTIAEGVRKTLEFALNSNFSHSGT